MSEENKPLEKKKRGPKPGASYKRKPGPRLGTHQPATLSKLMILKEVKEQIAARAASLVRAGFIPALGQHFVYKIEEEVTGHGPKGGEYKKRKHTLVTDPDEIASALDQIEEGGVDPDGVYYYVTVKEPNADAIDKLLNRAFGKPKESIDVTSNGETILGIKYISPEDIKAVREEIANENIHDAEFTEKKDDAVEPVAPTESVAVSIIEPS